MHKDIEGQVLEEAPQEEDDMGIHTRERTALEILAVYEHRGLDARPTPAVIMAPTAAMAATVVTPTLDYHVRECGQILIAVFIHGIPQGHRIITVVGMEDMLLSTNTTIATTRRTGIDVVRIDSRPTVRRRTSRMMRTITIVMGRMTIIRHNTVEGIGAIQPTGTMTTTIFLTKTNSII